MGLNVYETTTFKRCKLASSSPNRMIRTLTTLLFLTLVATLYGQQNPVEWSFSLGTSGDTHAVLAEAEVADGWYIYSQFLDEGGPIPTSFNLAGTKASELVGDPTETGDELSGFDEYFGMDVTKYAKQASFSQGIKVAEGTEQIVGTIRFMACTNKKCLPPTNVDIVLPIAR